MRTAVGALLAGAVLAGCGSGGSTKTIIIKTTTVTTSTTPTTSTTSSRTVAPTAVVAGSCSPYTINTSRRFGRQLMKYTIRISQIDARNISCSEARTLIQQADATLSTESPAPGVYISVPPWKCRAFRPIGGPNWMWISDCKRTVGYRLNWTEKQLRASSETDPPAEASCSGGYDVSGVANPNGGFFRGIRERNADCSAADSIVQQYTTVVAYLSGQSVPPITVNAFRCVTTSNGNANSVSCSDPEGRQVTFFGAP